MIAVLTLVVTVLVSGTAGGVAGRLIVRHWIQSVDHEPAAGLPPITPSLDAELDAAARAWARAHGRTGMEDLVASKLKLAAQLRGMRTQEWQR